MNQSCHNALATVVVKMYNYLFTFKNPQLQGSQLHTERETAWIYNVLYPPGTKRELRLVVPYGLFTNWVPRTLETIKGPVPHRDLPSEKVPKAQSRLRSCPLSLSTQGQCAQHYSYSGQPFFLPSEYSKELYYTSDIKHQWYSVRVLEKPVAVHSVFRKWPLMLLL